MTFVDGRCRRESGSVSTSTVIVAQRLLSTYLEEFTLGARYHQLFLWPWLNLCLPVLPRRSHLL